MVKKMYSTKSANIEKKTEKETKAETKKLESKTETEKTVWQWHEPNEPSSS